MSFLVDTGPEGHTIRCATCGATDGPWKVRDWLTGWKARHVCDLTVVRARRIAAGRPGGAA